MESGEIKETSAAPQQPAEFDTHDDEVDHEGLARLVKGRASAPQAFSPSISHAPQSAPVKSKALPLTALIILFFVLLAGATFFWLLQRATTKSPANPNLNTNQPNSNQPSPTGANMKREMVAIPGGSFQMGRADGQLEEGPPHPVTVHAFYMDNTEVTNAEYAEFVAAENYAPPSHWSGNKPVSGREQLPVTNVSFYDANAFAAWRSKTDGAKYRLPTEEEWEYAARNGDRNNLYPWGNEWMDGRAATKAENLSAPNPVGSYPKGKNVWGVMDLIGNVWEWTASKPSYYPGNSLTVLPVHQNWVIIRGGSLASDRRGKNSISAVARDWIDPTTKDDLLGFRLVREGK